MKAVDIPSLGAFSRSQTIRKDLAQVLSAIETAHSRGSDVTGHLEAVKQLAAHMLRFCKSVPKQPLMPSEPAQLSLPLALPTE